MTNIFIGILIGILIEFFVVWFIIEYVRRKAKEIDHEQTSE